MPKKTIEEIYQKKTQLEHILIRPDTYVGSVQQEKSTKWILREEDLKFRSQQITFVPALYKIFDEVLVNAADNYQRDNKMNLIKVDINPEEGYVSVYNDGKGIPVQIHAEHNIYVPELIFGHLLTGSNYDDEQKKVVGGRNGYGAKLANIFSHKFIVECGDSAKRKKFKMVWKKNMSIHGQAQIEGYSGKDFTSVTFYPEFNRFKMEKFDSDIVSLMRKRVYDMAGLLPTVKVELNGRRIETNSFLKYVDLYFSSVEDHVKIREENKRWQVVVSLSDGEFRQVSFVNGICTSKGGTHVNYVVDQIVERLQEAIVKKNKNLGKVKPFQIKSYLWVFVNCLIQNPAFDSQTKETLTIKPAQFGSQCQLSDKFLKTVQKTGIVDVIIQEVNFKEKQKLKKTLAGGKKVKLSGIAKLEDANQAGTKNSQRCTLILTEGDSAKSLAMAGIDIVGRDYYGVFPLKGKLLNVRQAPNNVLLKNEEIQNIIKILGIKANEKYEDTKKLRYGSIMIMSDQDTDGSHIKGLVINFIHYFWPELFRMRGFLKQFITPLLKAFKGRNCQAFYTMSDFKRWAETQENISSWKIKYYKGLGTSSDKEAQEYFKELERNRIYFRYIGQQDDDAIDLVFNKKNADKRKEWLSNYNPDSVLPYNTETVTYSQFINKQFIHFSNQDNQRSIVSIIDGFKPGQRKIIYSCFKRNLKDQIKVAQLAGYVSQHSAYHHGQMSLTITIVNMAQNFVGSNNINLLMPNGQFGSRNQGGKDHASARYIFTTLSRVTRYIFPEPDDHSLTYLEDDGQLVEPEFYVPIIPMCLVNGAEGIGSGWSTNIPSFDPRQVTYAIQSKLKGQIEDFIDFKPWYKGYSGQINIKTDGNYEVKGLLQFDQQKEGVIHIKELPVGKWTKDYKEYLESLMEQDNGAKVVSMRQYHTKNRVHFEIEVSERYYNDFREDLATYEKTFKMVSSISMKNMVGFNSLKRLFRYPNIKTILEEFYQVRLAFYGKRKEYLISKLQRDMEILENKQRFIIEVVEQKIVLRNIKKAKIVQILKIKGFKKYSQLTKIKSTKKVSNKKSQEDEENEEGEDEGRDESKEFNYLLTMPLWNLSYEKVEQIKRQCKEKQEELHILSKRDIKDLWIEDLEEFLKVLDKVENEEEQQRKKNDKNIKRDGKAQKAKKKPEKKEKEKVKKPKKKKESQWDSEEEFQPETNTEDKQQFGNGKKQRQRGKSNNQKQVKEEKKKPEEATDLLSRVKRKIEQENNDFSKLKVVTKLQNPKQTKLDGFVEANKNGKSAELVLVPDMKSSGKKRKMNLDSDEDEQWNESGDDWD